MILIKLGGNALAAATGLGWLDAIASARSKGLKLILVHGGGPQIDVEFDIRKMPKVVIGGYRVTDETAFGIVEMVLAGQVQQSLVRALRSRSIPAVGITGSDGGLFEVNKKYASDGADLGQVGEVKKIDPSLIKLLMEAGYLPIVSPVSSDGLGVGFNVNADLAAGALAGALHVERAVFMTDVPGIYRNYPDKASLIASTTLSEMKELLPSLSAGMVPKVESVIHALESGAKKANVIDGRDGEALQALLSGEACGTEIIHG
jgi:acetylglutamate kinase